MTSASVPAGRPTRKTGRLMAVCMSATNSGEGVRDVISQAAPTLCIQVPMLDATAAIQSERKTAWLSGLQGEAPASELPALLPSEERGFFTCIVPTLCLSLLTS